MPVGRQIGQISQQCSMAMRFRQAVNDNATPARRSGTVNQTRDETAISSLCRLKYNHYSEAESFEWNYADIVES